MQPEVLAKIESRLHDLIRERAGDLLRGGDIGLPRLDARSGSADNRCWFPVRGMYGGFSYWIDGEGSHAKLIVESWSRIADGWGAAARDHGRLDPDRGGSDHLRTRRVDRTVG